MVWYLVSGFPKKNKANFIPNWWSFRCLIIALGLMVIFSTFRQKSLVPPSALPNIRFPLIYHSDCSPLQCKRSFHYSLEAESSIGSSFVWSSQRRDGQIFCLATRELPHALALQAYHSTNTVILRPRPQVLL